MSPLFEPTTARTHVPTRHVAFARAIRRVLGVVNILAAITIVAAIAIQITEKVVNDVFRPTEYFAYFTIQSSLINIVVLLIGGYVALTRGIDPRWYTLVRACIVTYAIITGLVYNLLLADVPASDGFITEFPGLTNIVHLYIPIFVAVEWVLMPGRSRLSWRVVAITCAYPVVWLVATMIRGAADGWYPYPFLVPSPDGGMDGVITFVVVISALMITLSSIAVGIERAHAMLYQRLGFDRTAL